MWTKRGWRAQWCLGGASNRSRRRRRGSGGRRCQQGLELVLRIGASRCARRGPRRQPDALQVGAHRSRIGDRGDDGALRALAWGHRRPGIHWRRCRPAPGARLRPSGDDAGLRGAGRAAVATVPVTSPTECGSARRRRRPRRTAASGRRRGRSRTAPTPCCRPMPPRARCTGLSPCAT